MTKLDVSHWQREEGSTAFYLFTKHHLANVLGLSQIWLMFMTQVTSPFKPKKL